MTEVASLEVGEALVQNAFQPVMGSVYRTSDIWAQSGDPRRILTRLIEDGVLVRLARGLYAAPTKTKFGAVLPTSEAIMDVFLGRRSYVFTGPPYWNALALGSTALFPTELVYDSKRNGLFTLGGRRFLIRRRKFPKPATPEWYAVDLIQNRASVGLDPVTLRYKLQVAVSQGRLDPVALLTAAQTYGTRAVRDFLNTALTEAASDADV